MGRIIILLFFSLLLVSCSKSDEIEQESFGSYRYFLWRAMLTNDQQVDFIGTELDTYRYPSYQGQHFDGEHQGVGGIRSDEVLSNLNVTLSSIETPDVVLIGIGINDVFQGYPASFIRHNTEAMIDILQEKNPNVTIIVEQIAGLGPRFNSVQMQETVELYNSMVLDICTNKSNSSSMVIPVNIYDGFSDEYTSDDLHYNLRGSSYVAQQYYSVMRENLDLSLNLKILPIGDSRVVGYRSNPRR